MPEQMTLPGVQAELELDDPRDQWCTPPWVWRIPLELRNRGTYDLDPCSNDRSTVPAIVRVSPPSDGLAKVWSGLVWMNPPYSNVAPWFRRACASVGRGTEVWGLVDGAPGILAWIDWGPVAAWPLGRVRHVPPPGIGQSSPNQEHALVWWGLGPAPVLEHPRIKYRMVRT